MSARARAWCALASLVLWSATGPSAAAFDHGFAAYAELLRSVVREPRVDYAALKADRDRLDRVVGTFAGPSQSEEQTWAREQRMAFWINAYNALTLKAIVDHYPIRAGVFTRLPRNSIRQIDGVWTTLRWTVAGRTVTLDDIEHKILRPTFGDARVHFALNCASVSCPLLAGEPYRADTLDASLDTAARRYLASPEGLRVEASTLRVSSIFKWYGEDFIAQYSALVPQGGDAQQRAILGAIVRFGPQDAAERARTGRPRIEYLNYNWSLNDVLR
ncbi:MAG: DUF547 domain-containing protein [Acidobacteria bacterium]|nr:DUF547 domain-containing protein [Acidobacteriota bacterium]